MERKIFELSQENLELRFDAEQAKSDLPQLFIFLYLFPTQSSKGTVVTADDKAKDLERQVFELSQENLELRFDAEQAKSDLPRLRQRVKDLEGYNQALKADLERERDKEKLLSSRPSSVASSLRRVGRERNLGPNCRKRTNFSPGLNLDSI